MVSRCVPRRLHEESEGLLFDPLIEPTMNSRAEPEWALVTIAFIDIRGFTSLADRSTAREVAEYLNDFFGVVVPVVTEHGGRVHQLLGDGVLAVFGAPEAMPDHAERALAAALEVMLAVERHFGERCRIGIGVNSGLVVVGTIGGGGLELGIVGDPVNVAARVQDATRELGETLLLTESTRCLLEGDAGLEPRGVLRLRGKAEPVAIYTAGRNSLGHLDAEGNLER